MAFNSIIPQSDVEKIAQLIYKNECGGKKEKLTHWNKGEEFISLGIGHFIWYPKNYNGRFEESFPNLIKFMKKNKLKLPQILIKNNDCPWNKREEFLKDFNTKDLRELRDFLERTKSYQASFMYKRLEGTYEEIFKNAKDKKNVKKQFKRLIKSKNGIYPLIDYINFKGSGLSKKERYKGQAWGLLQVLENMKGKKIGETALKDFADSAKEKLRQRIKNSLKSRNEKRWLKGWEKRIDTYWER